MPIYCFSFGNPDRKDRLQKRFELAGLKCTFVEPTLSTDPQIKSPLQPRNTAIMLDHLKMIRHFYEETKAEQGIFCEDDIYIRKSIKDDLPNIVKNFTELNLDLLLLGYLLPFNLHSNFSNYSLKSLYTYHSYPDDLWGAEMYMLSRKQAKYLLDKYTIEFALKHPEIPFASDWTITKEGNRAMIYPMLAVEEGQVNTDHQGQINYHRQCAKIQYDPRFYT